MESKVVLIDLNKVDVESASFLEGGSKSSYRYYKELKIKTERTFSIFGISFCRGKEETFKEVLFRGLNFESTKGIIDYFSVISDSNEVISDDYGKRFTYSPNKLIIDETGSYFELYHKAAIVLDAIDKESKFSYRKYIYPESVEKFNKIKEDIISLLSNKPNTLLIYDK